MRKGWFRGLRPARGLRPEEAFPKEVVALHDEQGVPWPTWYSGPLYDPSKLEEAHRAFAEYMAARPGDVREGGTG